MRTGPVDEPPLLTFVPELLESLAPYSHVLDKTISFISASTRLTASRSRILAIGALFLVASASFVSTTQAQDVRVVHAIELNRDGRYTANVMVTNMTSTTIRNWTMTFRMSTVVESINHVGWSQFQGAFTVNGRGWAKEIAPGDVVWFTISGLSYNNVVEVPRNCFFNGTACVVSGAPQPVVAAARPDQMIVSAWFDKSDATTYSGYIAIFNPTDLKFPALWDLKFSTPSLLVELKEVIWTRSGSDYQVYGHAHTDYIDAGNYVMIPIRGVHTGTPALPSNCRLNGVECTFKTPLNILFRWTTLPAVSMCIVAVSPVLWSFRFTMAEKRCPLSESRPFSTSSIPPRLTTVEQDSVRPMHGWLLKLTEDR